MTTWDQPSAAWDGPLTWDAPAPPSPVNPTPTRHRKHMIRQNYFPTRIGDQIVWLRNFKIKLPTHATALGLDPAAVTAILLDVDTAIYGLDLYRGALAPAMGGCYQCIDIALYEDAVAGNVAWQGFTPPAGAPAAVPNGCLKRVFTFIADEIKASAGYNTAIGEDLGVEGTLAPPPPSPGDTSPEFDLRATGGGKLEVVWTKGRFDGVKLEFDLGTAGIKTDMDLRPNYTLNWLPATGQTAVIRVRLLYLYKGEEYGNWSDWQQWTLTGV